MTFKEAKDKLRTMANGRYHSLLYDLTEYEDGHLVSGCRVYIDPGFSSGANRPTWEEAFEALEKDMNPSLKQAPVLSEAPE